MSLVDAIVPWLAYAIMTAGALLMLIAALGVVRMPDLFRRLHCSTKSATLGVLLMLAGAALHIGTPGAWIRALAASLFFLLTAPVGGHALGRAAWRRGLAGTAPPDDQPDDQPDAPASAESSRSRTASGA